MFGKNKCKILKEIRQKIADENDIPYVTRECTYQGECSGTCPKCEQELRYLEQQLSYRQRLGKAIVVTALAAGMSLTMAGCNPPITDNAGEAESMPQATVATVDPDNPSAGGQTANATGDGSSAGGQTANATGDGSSVGGQTAGGVGGNGTTPEDFFGELEGDVAYVSEGEKPEETKSTVSTKGDGYDPSEGLPIVLPPDEFDD